MSGVASLLFTIALLAGCLVAAAWTIDSDPRHEVQVITVNEPVEVLGNLIAPAPVGLEPSVTVSDALKLYELRITGRKNFDRPLQVWFGLYRELSPELTRFRPDWTSGGPVYILGTQNKLGCEAMPQPRCRYGYDYIVVDAETGRKSFTMGGSTFDCLVQNARHECID
jgi:hypothetical protein